VLAHSPPPPPPPTQTTRTVNITSKPNPLFGTLRPFNPPPSPHPLPRSSVFVDASACAPVHLFGLRRTSPPVTKLGLLDSGAGPSCLTCAVIHPQWEVLPATHTLYAANGTPMHSHGTVRLRISLDSSPQPLTITHTFHILETLPYPVVIGRDILFTHNLHLEYPPPHPQSAVDHTSTCLLPFYAVPVPPTPTVHTYLVPAIITTPANPTDTCRCASATPTCSVHHINTVCTSSPPSALIPSSTQHSHHVDTIQSLQRKVRTQSAFIRDSLTVNATTKANLRAHKSRMHPPQPPAPLTSLNHHRP
jgi:hypothetical protein